jgi:hypothetical protein
MVTVTRWPVALLLTLTLPVGSVCAPFLHAHVNEDADHDHETSIHSHFSGHTPHHPHQGRSIDEPDHDRAIYLQTFVATQATPFEIPATAPEPFAVPVPSERPACPPVEITHGHDPPCFPASALRAPPDPARLAHLTAE